MNAFEQYNGLDLPTIYADFLATIPGEGYEIGNSGIVLYSVEDISERNDTYEVKQYAADALLIGQDGDLGFFIRKDHDERIFSLDLGAAGSLEMNEEANDIHHLIATRCGGYEGR